MVLHTPSKPEKPEGDENGADIRKGKAKLRECVAIVPRCEIIVHRVDAGHDEKNSDEEACAKAEVHEANASRGIAVAVGAPDVFEVGVETVVRAEKDGLIYSHGKDDGLRKQYPEGSQHGMKQFSTEAAVVLAFEVDVGGRVGGLIGGPAGLKDDGSVGLFKEDDAKEGVGATDDGEDPKYPTPGKVLDDEAAEEGAKGGAHKRAKEVPAKDTGTFFRAKHVTNRATTVGNADTWGRVSCGRPKEV